MSITDLFKKGNILFTEKRFFDALETYKEIWLKYPLNTRLYEEINKKIKIYKEPVLQTFSNNQIEEFFQLQKQGHVSTVINTLLKYLERHKADVLTISLLGKFYELKGDNEKGLYYHKMSVEKAPFEVAFYLNLSNTLKQLNKLGGVIFGLIKVLLFLLAGVYFFEKWDETNLILSQETKESSLLYPFLSKASNILLPELNNSKILEIPASLKQENNLNVKD